MSPICATSTALCMQTSGHKCTTGMTAGDRPRLCSAYESTCCYQLSIYTYGIRYVSRPGVGYNLLFEAIKYKINK